MARKKSKPRRWSPEEDAKLREYFEAGDKYQRISRRLRRSLSSVKNRLALFGLRRNEAPNPVTTRAVNMMLELHKSGVSGRKIAAQLGTSVNVVSYHLQRRGCILNNKWTESEDELLRQMVGRGESAQEISSALCRTVYAVQARARFLGAVSLHDWTPEQEDFLVRNYGRMTGPEISRHILRTPIAIMQKAKKLGLVNRDFYWKDWQVEILKKHYADTDNDRIAAMVGKKRKSVATKAERLGLRKSREYIRDLARNLAQRKVTVNPFDVNRTVPMNYVEDVA